MTETQKKPQNLKIFIFKILGDPKLFAIALMVVFISATQIESLPNFSDDDDVFYDDIDDDDEGNFKFHRDVDGMEYAKVPKKVFLGLVSHYIKSKGDMVEEDLMPPQNKKKFANTEEDENFDLVLAKSRKDRKKPWGINYVNQFNLKMYVFFKKKYSSFLASCDWLICLL